METTTSLITAETPALHAFIQSITERHRKHVQLVAPRVLELFDVVHETEVGPRYIRVVRSERAAGTDRVISRSAHSFIERTTGNVLKAAGWKGPAKGSRGNIFSADGGLARMGPYGPEYNR